jgi:flagellar hook assembly protein FlgD
MVIVMYASPSMAYRPEGTLTYKDYLIILIHGINSGSYMFNGQDSVDPGLNYKKYLERDLGLEGHVYAYSFTYKNGSNKKRVAELADRTNNNTATYIDDSGNEASMNGLCWLDKAKEDYKSWFKKKYNRDPQASEIPSRYIFITHSMGNMAARLYIYSDEIQSNLQNNNIRYNYDVDKTVFVAPPFMGSDMAYLAIMPKSLFDGYVLYTKTMMYKDMFGYLFSSPNTFLVDPYMPYKATKEICFWIVNGPAFEDQYEAFFGLNGKPVDQLECGGFGVLRGAEDEGLKELMPELLVNTYYPKLPNAFLSDPTKEPDYSVVYGQGMPVVDIQDSIFNQMTKIFSKKILSQDIVLDVFPQTGNVNDFMSQMSSEMLTLMPGSNFYNLSTSQAKFYSLTFSNPFFSLSTDGDGALPVSSAKGIFQRSGTEIKTACLKEALFYRKTFDSGFSDFLNNDMPAYTDAAVILYTGLRAGGVPHEAALAIAQWGLAGIFLDKVGQYAEDLRYDFNAHNNILKENTLISTALLDSYGILTLQDIQCSQEIESIAASEEVRHYFTSITPEAGWYSIAIRSFDTRNNTNMSVVGPIPATIDGSREYLSQILVTQKPEKVIAKLNYLIPQKLKQFQYSFNFQAWQDVPNVDNYTGVVTFEGLHFAEGQNLLAIRTTNYAGIKYNQLIKIILNTIPMQASRYLPESNFMTNNIYQSIGVEFNKSTYYADEAGKIQIVSFEVDGTPKLSDANITSEIDGAYHPYARVNYTPKEPLSDGEHAIVVQAKSDVGVSQAIWSFFVDTQPPTISIEALQPYSPRVPNAQPISIKYKTADNLSTFLKNISARLYDSKNNFITELATFDTQAVGDNFISVNSALLTVNGSLIPDGTYSIKIKAYDYASNVTTESVALTIDSTPPSIIEADVNPKPMTSNSDSMNFSSELSEDSIVTIKMINKATGVASAYVAQAQKSEVDSEKCTATYNWSYNNQFVISGPEDGLYKLEIIAQDKAGNVSDPYIIDNIKIDRTPPVIFSNACLPYVLANVGNNPYTTTLSYQISESNDKAENKGDREQRVGVRVTLINENTGELIKTWSSAPANINSVNTIPYALSSMLCPGGAYKFEITATDASGNSSTAYSTCLKDGIAPIISFPANDRTVTGTIAIRGTAVDPDWTNNLPFKDYKVYYAKGNVVAPVNFDNLSGDWKSDFVEVPEINRSRDVQSQAPGNVGKNISIRPLQNDSTLAYLYSNGLENGTYTILLVAEEDGGRSSACTRVIEVRNDPMVASTDVPVVKLNPLPQKVHFTADGKVKLPISFINGIKKSNVNIEIAQLHNATITNEGVVFYKFQPNIVGNQYTGKPSYTPGKDLGYYIWTDEAGWHIRWSSDGTNHHFTGSLMGSGLSGIRGQGIELSNANGSFVNWDKTMSGGEAGIDFTADSGAMVIITPKIDEDLNVPAFNADNIYLGMTKATQAYLPVMINTSMEGVAPAVVNWDGKLDTGGFADSGVYTVRVRSEGADGAGLATDEAQVQVETDYDISNVEAVNKSFSPVGAPDRVSIYYNVSKDSYITAYVYQDGSDTPVATITSEAFAAGNMNTNHKHVINWRGNYPNPDSTQFFNGGGFNIKIIATAADGTGSKEIKIDGISIAGTRTDASLASLDPIGDEVQFNGVPSRIANGSSDYFFEARGTGRLYPPKEFSFNITPYGKQTVTIYPYVPFAALIHRGYKEVDVRMKGSVKGIIREWFTEDSAGASEQINNHGFNVGLQEMEWGFRNDNEKMNIAGQKGPYANYKRNLSVYSVYEGRNSGAKVRFHYDQTFSMTFYTRYGGSNSYFLDRIDNIPVMEQFDIDIPPATEKLGEAKEKEYVKNKLDTILNNMTTVYPSEKGMFKVEINYDDFNINIHTVDASYGMFTVSARKRVATIQPPIGKNGTDFWSRARVMLEAPVQYSRLTNRFIPFFGFVNRNTSEVISLGGMDKDLNSLGFPGRKFFLDVDAKPYNEFDAMLVSAEALTGLSRKDLIAALSKLETQSNYTGFVQQTGSEVGFDYYLTDPISSEFGNLMEGLEMFPITVPDGGTFEIQGLQITAKTGLKMAYNTNPPSYFSFNFPASDAEIMQFQTNNDALLAKLKKSPSLWTGISRSSPHELDINSVTQSIEAKTKAGQEIKYGTSGYYYKSDTLGSLWGWDSTKYPDATDIRYSVNDISDQSITLKINREGTGEYSTNAYLVGSIPGASGQMWTTADDQMLSAFGGCIASREIFNRDGFSGYSQYISISDPYINNAVNLQNMNSPNMTKYTFWKYDPLVSSVDAFDPVDNQYLTYDNWSIGLKDLSGAENSDLAVETPVMDSDHLKDRFRVKLKLDSAEKKYVEIKGYASGAYYLMYFDGSSWKQIRYSSTGANGTLGWWNVSRLNGKYTVVLKLADNDVISSQDILIGSLVKNDQVTTVTSPYKRAEVTFKPGAFDKEQLVTVTPVKMDEIDISNRPLIPTVGPIVEVKPSPYYFSCGSTESEDLRPTLVFKYTKEDLKEMYPNLDVDSTSEVSKLGLNIHQITENGDLQVVSDNKQGYNEGIYAFEGPLDHFSEYALIRGKYNLKAPIVQTDRSIVNYTPITIYGTAPADSVINVYVSPSKEVDISSLESVASLDLPKNDPGIGEFRFNKIPLITEGDNYIFVASTQRGARTLSHIKVKYDLTPPTAEAIADIPAFSPNGDGKFDIVTYKIKSNENGKLYFTLKDTKGETIVNYEVSCEANVEIKIYWDGDQVYLYQGADKIVLGSSQIKDDGEYSYIVFAVDEAGNISNNVVGKTIVDRISPKISGLTASPNPFTPNDDHINDTTTISFEVNEPSYATIKIFRGSELFKSYGFSCPLSLAPCSYIWDGRGDHNELIGGSYSYYVEAEDSVGNISTSETRNIIVDREPYLVQSAYCDPYYFAPKNPKNNMTNIKYSLSRDDVKVTVQIFDGTGRVIATPLDDQVEKSGEHQVSWNGSEASLGAGSVVIDGTYGFRVKAMSVDGSASGEVTGNLVIDNIPPTIVIKKCEVGDARCKLVYSIPEDAKVTVNVVDENGVIIDTIVTGESQKAGLHDAVWIYSEPRLSVAGSSNLRFNVFAEDKALNTDEKQSVSFSLPGPLEITDASAAPAIFNPNSEVINKYTTAKYKLSAKAGQAQVTIKVLSDAGATVKRLTDGEYQAPGAYSLVWYGDDLTNKTVAAGNYKFDISAVDNLGNKASQQIPVIVAANSSCVLSVSPEVFSPNGDTIADTATFTYTVDYYWQLTGEANIQLDVLNGNGKSIYTYSNHHTQGTYTHVWNGQGAYDGQFNAIIKLTDPAGSIVYSNTVPIKADMQAGSSLPEKDFINNNGFTPNGDGQNDTCAFSYYLAEPSYVTVIVHTFSATASYDATNLVKTLVDNVLTSAGTDEVIWDGSTDGPGDTDSNGFANKGKYVFVLEATDQYGNISPKQGATVWVQEAPLLLTAPPLIENPTPKVVSSNGDKINFSFTLSQSLEGGMQLPEKFMISGMKIKSAGIYDMGKVTVKVYDHSGSLAATLANRQTYNNDGTKTVSWDGSGAAEGEYTVIASAEDLTGVPAVQSISGITYLDKTPPVISGISVARDFFSPGINSDTINYSVSDNLSTLTTDVANKVKTTVMVYKNDVLVKTITDSATKDSGAASADVWDGTRNIGGYVGTNNSASNEPDGEYTIKISAVDVAGNTAEVSQAVYVDTVQPDIRNISISPSPFSPGGAKPNSSITANITDECSVTWEVKIETGANPVISSGSGASVSYTWNGMDGVGSYEGDSPYNCIIKAYDDAGNMEQITRVITTDTTAPIITASASPKIFGGTSKCTTVEFEINDSNPHIWWNARINNCSSSGSAEGTMVQEARMWDTELYPATDDDYNFVIFATDEAGNTAISIETVSYDKTNPHVSISTVESIWCRGAVNVYGTVQDAHPGTWTLYYSEGTIASGTGAASNELLGTFDVGTHDGDITVFLVATDEAGNPSDVVSQTYFIDNTPPVVTCITSEVTTSEIGPSMRNYFNPYIDTLGIDIMANVFDNSYDTSKYHDTGTLPPISISAEVWLGETIIKRLGSQLYYSTSETHGFTWNGSNESGNVVNEGVYTVKLHAVDTLGNISTSEYQISLFDDLKITSQAILGSYSHDPNLALSGSNLSLKFITGECYETISTYRMVNNHDIKNSVYSEFPILIGQDQTDNISNSGIGQAAIYNENGVQVYIKPAPKAIFLAGVYKGVVSVGSSSNASQALEVFHIEQIYNYKKIIGISSLSVTTSISTLESKWVEAHSFYVNDRAHYVYSSKMYWPGQSVIHLNNSEIIYGEKQYKNFPSGVIYNRPGWGWFWDCDFEESNNADVRCYPKQTRISSCDGNSINPAIATDSTGYKVYVAWEDYRNNGNTKGKVYLTLSTNSGETWPADGSLIASSSGNCMMPSVAIKEKASGGYHIYIAYVDDSNAGNKELFVKKGTINSAGDVISWTGTARLTRHEFTPLCNASRPSIVCDASGTAYVVWEDTRTGTSEIFFQKIPYNFAPFSGSGMTTMSVPFAPVIVVGQQVILSGASTPELISPINGATVKSLRPTFKWYGVQNIKDYRIECATSSSESSLANSMDYFNATISDVSGAKPICEFTQSEHFMGLDESTPGNPYWYWRVQTVTSEASTSEVGSFRIELPSSLSGVTNWPNPFDPNKERTKIRYKLGRQPDSVTIRIYDITGALVKELEGTTNPEGASIWDKYNDVEWDGRNGRGDLVLNGVYPFEITVSYGDKSVTGRGKAVVLK